MAALGPGGALRTVQTGARDRPLVSVVVADCGTRQWPSVALGASLLNHRQARVHMCGNRSQRTVWACSAVTDMARVSTYLSGSGMSPSAQRPGAPSIAFHDGVAPPH